MERNNLKKDILAILTPIFGEDIKKTIGTFYESEKPEEIFELARYLLGGYMGETNADKLLGNIMKKYPGIK